MIAPVAVVARPLGGARAMLGVGREAEPPLDAAAPLQEVAIGLAILDRDLRVTQVDEAAAAALGAPIASLLGTALDEGGAHLAPLVDALRRVLRGDASPPAALVGRSARGERRTWYARVAPIAAGGERVGVAVAIASTDAAGRGSDAGALAWQRLAAIVESSDDAIVGRDVDGVITSWNDGATRLFGFTAAEMVGRSITPLLPPPRQDEERIFSEKVARGERVKNFETVRLTKDGARVDVSVTMSPIRDASGNVVGTSKILRDVTAVKARERELARTSRLYSALSHVNQAIVWKRSRDELLGMVCRGLVEHGGFCMAWVGWSHPESGAIVPIAQFGDTDGYLDHIAIATDDRPEGRGPTGTAFREGRPYVCNDLVADPATLPWRPAAERRGFRASAVFPIREKGKVRGTLSVYADEPDFFRDKEIALLAEAADDVSFALDNLVAEEERRRAEAVAHREKVFSETMIESMPGVLYFYDEAGRFIRWNRNMELVTGYSGDELARMHPLDLLADADKDRVGARIVEVFARGESAVEARLAAKDGRAIPYFFTGKRVEFDGITCLVGVGIDVTERTRAEAALRELNETLEQKVSDRTAELKAALVRAEAADRLKSAFLASMSHELRTPLNSIIGFTGIVLQGLAGPLTAEQSKQLGMVRGSARHLLELINDVLDLSKIEAEQLQVRAEAFELPAVIDRAVATVKPMADKKGLALDVAIAPDLRAMVSDRRRVEQILLNLLQNAIKFTARGTITLRAEAVSGRAVRLAITDTGIGIKPEDLAILFKPFQQIDTGLTRQHEGTGLGLAICLRLARLLGGDITVHSEWEVGSTFVVTLPLRMADATPAQGAT